MQKRENQAYLPSIATKDFITPTIHFAEAIAWDYDCYNDRIFENETPEP